MLHEGDEWVTSETKWITSVILWCTYCYSAMGDKLQSSVKILFFFLQKWASQFKACDASVDPSLCLRSAFASVPLLLRFKTVSNPFLIMGLTWESQGTYKGGRGEKGLNEKKLALACYVLRNISCSKKIRKYLIVAFIVKPEHLRYVQGKRENKSNLNTK